MMTQVAVGVLALTLTGTAATGCGAAREAVPRAAVGKAADPQVRTMKIRIKIEGRTLTATLLDNETSRDFASLIPLTLTLTDYAQTEKTSDLPRKLSTKGTPPGSDPSAGDIAYYAPWGNLALYYKDFEYSSGLVKLGRLDSGVDTLRQAGPLKVTIESAADAGNAEP